MNLKFNLGNTDRIIRLIIATIISLLVFAGIVQGAILVIILDALAIILVVTSSLNYSPIYAIFGISSKKQMQRVTFKSKKTGFRSK